MVSFTLPAQEMVREQYAVKMSVGTAGQSVVCRQLRLLYALPLRTTLSFHRGQYLPHLSWCLKCYSNVS